VIKITILSATSFSLAPFSNLSKPMEIGWFCTGASQLLRKEV
jgi:hypothetical protein